MANVSPGVFSTIRAVDSYVAQVPSTIAFIPFLSKKGRDNELIFIGGRGELTNEWGTPNINEYGKNYGQGLYNLYNFLGESGSAYGMRCMPTDATYANIRIDAQLAAADATAAISVSYNDSLNTTDEIKTNLVTVGDTKPLCFLYPIGRGEYYNGISVRFTEHSNPLLNGIYVLDIYERQDDGDDVIIESFEVSFDPTVTDNSGDSIWIQYILETYSSILRAEMTLASEAYTDGYNLTSRIYDKDQSPTTSAVLTAASATLTDEKQDFSDWETAAETGNASYVVVAKDARGNSLYGWLGASDTNDTTINVFDGRDLDTATQSWVGDTSVFDGDRNVTYEIKQSNANIADAFVSATPVPLRKGSDGSLVDSNGDVDTATATQILSNAYAGTIDDSVLDIENVYFNLVFDAGYPSDVKTQIGTLATTRRDCVALIDNGDNATVNAAITSRNNTNTFNTFYCALYEQYNKIYDIHTGNDIWVSPMYHMTYLAPRNDNVADVWWAIAGFERGVPEGIKGMRYNPRLGQRDRMYLKQLNPIVKFSEGYVVWGNLTSQARVDPLQDLNVVRLYLYVKRALERYCRYYIFQQNDATTWSSVTKDIVEFLEEVKKDRGLDSYAVEVSATAYEKKRKKFHANVTMNPTETTEQIDLNFFVTN